MLDVHPPHHAANTWRDFFIHIATIVVGLLIAVGIEQTVEYFHHRSLAREGREQLNHERDADARSNELNIFTTERHETDLKRDLAILHAVRAHQPLPSQPFILRRFRFVYPEDTWLRLHQNGTAAYMDGQDLRAAAYRYFNQDSFSSRAAESIETLSHSASILRGEDDPLQISLEQSVIDGHFLDNLVDGHFTMSEAAMEDGYASLVEHADLTQLTPGQIDELERAIKLALADDDAQLYFCFNVKRNLKNNPVR